MRRLGTPGLSALLAGAVLVLAPFATATTAADDAAAVVAGSGTSYTLTWTAGGDAPLRCLGLILLPGEVATAATGPAGWTIRALPLPGDPQGRWVVHATQPPPGLAPGATLPIQFTTQSPLAPNTPREIRFSSTCVVGSDVVKQSTGPTAPPPPPPPPPSPKPKKCACDSLDVRLGSRIASAREVHLDLDWALECTKGDGGCEGRLDVELSTASRRASVRLLVVQEGTGRATGGRWLVDCEGRCSRNRGRKTSGEAQVSLDAPEGTAFGPRGIGSVTLEVDRLCKRRLTTRRFLVAFNAGGKVSLRRSDLNGNGVADGKEKKR